MVYSSIISETCKYLLCYYETNMEIVELERQLVFVQYFPSISKHYSRILVKEMSTNCESGINQYVK